MIDFHCEILKCIYEKYSRLKSRLWMTKSAVTSFKNFFNFVNKTLFFFDVKCLMLNVSDDNIESADVLFSKIMSCEINIMKNNLIIFLLAWWYREIACILQYIIKTIKRNHASIMKRKQHKIDSLHKFASYEF